MRKKIGQEKGKDRQSWLDKDDKIIKKRAVTGKAVASSGMWLQSKQGLIERTEES